MTDKRDEALKLALKALQYLCKPLSHGWEAETQKEKRDQAITSIREALADSALDRMAENARDLGLDYEPPCKTGSQCTNKCQQCEHPAQQQEPVAYDKTEINCFAQDLYDQKMREGKRGHYESMFHVIHQCIKKVSPPASKPWVGLTDEEMREIYKRTDWDMAGGWEYERAIEAKLREKNAQPSQLRSDVKPLTLTDEQWQEIAAITGCVRIEKRGRDAILRVLQEAAHGIKGDA